MTAPTSRLATLVALVLFASCNCQQGEPPKPCKFDSDCGSGLKCDPAGKVCVVKTVCPETPCADTETCIDSRCLLKTCPGAAATCGAAQVCLNGQCTDESCVTKQCGGGETCVKGGCYVAGCTLDSCTQNEICTDEVCTSKKCVGVTCGAGERCAADGNCYPTGMGTGGGNGGTGGGSGSAGGGSGSTGGGSGSTGGGSGSTGGGSGSTGGGSGSTGGGSGSTGGGSGSTGGGSGSTGGGSGSTGGGSGSTGGGSGSTGGGSSGTGGGSGSVACGGQCSAAQVCVAGVCQETRCVGVSCPSGQACASGQCVPTDCGAGPCPSGQVCGLSGTCTPSACANVTCPGGYKCSTGVCVPSSADGGIPRLPDGGPGVVVGPDGGIIGLVGPDGGVLRGPDGGVIGGPCLPGQCNEIACSDGIDNNNNGLVDCQEPTCNGQTCASTNICAFGLTCQALSCTPARTITCNSPPAGPCFGVGVCLATESCTYPPALGRACGDGGSCMVDGGCGVVHGPGIDFTYTPSNFRPTDITDRGPDVELNTGMASLGFDSTTNTFSGPWGAAVPAVSQVTLSNGRPAVVLSATVLSLGADVTLRLTGNKPVIFAVFGDAAILGIIDVSAHGVVPGAGGNHAGCGVAGPGLGTGGGVPGSGAGGAGSGTVGGAGGASSLALAGGAGGPSRPVVNGVPLQGGCPGGQGGNAGGLGGAGGGAFQISASGDLSVGNLINASGAGGKGGKFATRGGGGGGGSAGTIVLEGMNVSSPYADIVANGGAGGEGSGDGELVNTDGNDGADGYTVRMSPTSDNAQRQALGGAGGSPNGGDGGKGGARLGAATAGLPGTRLTVNLIDYQGSGGGGGGASGQIHVNAIGTCMLAIANNLVFTSPKNTGSVCGQ